jgi:hypothetical protein
VKVRYSSLFDTANIAPVGSKTWAEENRKALQDALDTTVDGKVRLTNAMQYFWSHAGWKLLEDREGKPFRSMRAFALAEKPHGLHMSLAIFKAFMKDLGSAIEETVAEAEANPVKRGRRAKISLHSNDISQGNTTDYLTRRIIRSNNPALLEEMKAGKYPSVRAADRGVAGHPHTGRGTAVGRHLPQLLWATTGRRGRE